MDADSYFPELGSGRSEISHHFVVHQDSVDLAEFHESTRTVNDRFGVEDIDALASYAVDDEED